MADHGQQIIDLDKQRMEAMVRKDLPTLNAVLSDDLVYTHTSARVDTKQSLIEGLESGTTVSTFEPSDVQAQDLGDVVVLTGSVRIHMTVSLGGKPLNFRARYTAVYANDGERWQLVASQSTRLPESG